MPQTISLPIQGGCQCGELRYEVSKAPLMIYACHCTNCQKIAGSAFGLAATIFEDAFEFTSGTPRKLTWKSDAGSERFGLFCGDCGCRIVNGQNPSNNILSLRAGTFDNTRWPAPMGHIWTQSAQPWFTFNEDEIIHKEQPPKAADYIPMMEKFKTLFSFSD